MVPENPSSRERLATIEAAWLESWHSQTSAASKSLAHNSDLLHLKDCVAADIPQAMYREAGMSVKMDWGEV